MAKRSVFLSVLLAAVALAAGAQQTIRVGYFELQPYAYPVQGQRAPAGAAVEYWSTYVAPAMGVTVEWVGPTPLLRLLSQMDSGALDAVLVLGKNPERAAKYLLPPTPYMHFRPGLAVLKESPLNEIKTQDDVAGFKVGYAEGAVVVDFMKTARITWDNVTTATWVQDGLTKLAAKRVDAVFDLGIDALRYQASLTFPGRFRFVGLPIPPADLYTGFAKTDRGAAFLKLYIDANARHVASMAGIIDRYLAGK